MKKIILITALLMSLFSYSQQTRDVVYLKNGSIVKGTITEMNPSKDLKIETSDGSLFVYQMSDILKMEKEEYKPVNHNSTNVLKTESSVSESEAKKTIISLLDKNPTHQCPAINLAKPYTGNIKLEQWLGLYKQSDYEMIAKTVIQYTNCYYNKPDREPINFYYHLNTNNKWVLDKIKFEGGDFGGNQYLTGWLENMKLSLANIEKEKQQQIVRQEKAAVYKKAGDWKQADITELNFTPLYLNANNVPLFERSRSRITVKKLPKKCVDCRNDNIMEIESTIKNTFLKTKRYFSITEDEYKNSSNTAKFSIYISQISFTHRGVDEKGNDKGFSCNIGYSVSIRANYTEPQKLVSKETNLYNAKSRSSKYFSNKEAAFKGALLDLRVQISKLVYKYEPISLEVNSIQLDKKGNPEYIILEETSNFSNRRKIEFYILEKSALSIKDGKFSVSNIIGQVTYKKSDFPNIIKMKIKKSKMKKALKKYIGMEPELIGFSK